MDKRIFWVWLQQAVGCGWTHTGSLLRVFANAEQVWLADEAALRAAGVGGTALKRLMNKTLDKAGKQLRAALARGWVVLTPDMDDFPVSWQALPDMPLVIYATGALPENRQERLMLSIIATRDISTEGLTLTSKMAAGLASAGVIIAGDTIAGGDVAVMAAVSSVGGCGIIVQPCGLDVSYPKKSEPVRDEILETGGIMLSEFPAGTPVRRENYHIRNRLLATLSDAIVVTEAKETSGTLKVARLAVAAGHEVLAVPGNRACHAGCHLLIREGAALVQSGEEVAREFADRYPWLNPEEVGEAERRYVAKPMTKKQKKPTPLPRYAQREIIRLPEPEPAPMPEVADLPAGISANARLIAERLTFEPQGKEELAEKTPLSLPEAMMALTELELCGVAKSHVGGRYSRKG